MKPADLLWLTLLLATISGATWWMSRPPREQAYLQLILKPRLGGEGFGLVVDSQLHCQSVLHGEERHFSRPFAASDMAALQQSLEEAQVWSLKDEDEGAPESDVLYTTLELSWGGRHQRSFWRGLSEAQGKVARALLASPVGPAVQCGIGQVQARKAEINSGCLGPCDDPAGPTRLDLKRLRPGAAIGELRDRYPLVLLSAGPGPHSLSALGPESLVADLKQEVGVLDR